MLISVLIAIVSVVLLAYWFRYTCILLLRSNAEQPSLDRDRDLDPLRQSLERDYRMLTYVWRHAANLGDQSIEERILMADFKIMRAWYFVARSVAPAQARRAIAEMGAVVTFLGQKLGQQAGLAPGDIQQT
jgi:hypothetical protein